MGNLSSFNVIQQFPENVISYMLGRIVHIVAAATDSASMGFDLINYSH